MTSLNPPLVTPRPAHEQDTTRADGPPWFDRMAWPLFAVAAAIATILILWWGRDRTLTADEMIWFMQTPDLDLGGAFEPHVGHLILTTRLVYKAVFSILGVGYLPFQLLTIATVIAAAGLFFAYAGRRIGKPAALAPTLLLLVFGSDPVHLLSGNGFTVIGALACGLGALVALDRDDRRGDVIACALLCLGVVTYTVALAFVVGVAVSVLLREDRWRRIWIVAIPIAIYVAWWLWALGSDASSENQLALADALLFPSWAFQSLSAALGALTGLDYSFSDTTVGAGQSLAVLALIGLGWRFGRPVPRMLWAALGIAFTLWMMGAVSRTLLRVPDSERYLYPDALVVLVIGVWAAAGFRWRRPALIALFVVAAVGVLTNVALLRDGGSSNRVVAMQQRAVLAGIDVAGAGANPGYVPDDAPVTIAFSFGGENTTGAYLTAAEAYGSVGYSADELRDAAEPLRALADKSLVGALGLALAPAPEAGAPGQNCATLGGDPGQVPSLELAPGQTVVLKSEAAAAVQVRRFAGLSGVGVGNLQPGEPQSLTVPADQVPDPWQVTSAAPTRACVSG